VEADAKANGLHGVIICSDIAPLTDHADQSLGSYFNKTLAAIVTRQPMIPPGQFDLRVITNPDRKKPVDYVMQYQESDFDFLNRLSAEYYEWFFYDGENLHFGKPTVRLEVP